MHGLVRYVWLVLVVLIGLYLILNFTREGRVPTPALEPWNTQAAIVDGAPSPYWSSSASNSSSAHGRVNATILMLARNSEVDDAVRSVRDLEDKFNHKFGYPWVFLNEEEFSEEFKTRVSNVVQSPVEFGLIPHEHWFQPDWIDEEKATAGRNKMVEDNIIYGGSVSYRNMCRFNSGFFYRHPLLQKYKWYWRVEPNIHYHCNINYDPFRFMQENNKIYGFTITMYEYWATIPTLWDTVKEFIAKNRQFLPKDNAMKFLSNDGGSSYNLCHFWSNFEIADMDFWRSEAYTKFFEHLDATGGFYYERWGDAPVHSIAAALFARKDQLHFFSDIGYEHAPYTHCPREQPQWRAGKCSCNPGTTFDYDGVSCMPVWDELHKTSWW